MDYRSGEREQFTLGEGAAQEPDICATLVEAIVQIESAGNSRRVGSKGERGLMQVKRTTWAEVTGRIYGQDLPFDRAFDPRLNRLVGVTHLRQMREFLGEYRDQWQADERSLLLACYNAGPARVREAGFSMDRMPASTRDYVERASALHQCLQDEPSSASVPSGV